MFDPRLYREACRELTAPEHKIEEVIAMTEKTNKKRIRPLRTALIAAAAVAMMVVSVAAANPEEFQTLLWNLGSVVQVDRYRSDVTTEDGETFPLLSLPAARLENRDGRAVLTFDGEEVADITDALAREQHYVFEDFSEDTRVTATVDGTIDEWTIKTRIGVVKEDGTYDEFGGETITSEDVDNSLSGGIFFSGDLLDGRSTDVADAEVTYSMVTVSTDDCEADQ